MRSSDTEQRGRPSTIDGISPASYAAPADAGEVAATLADAANLKQAVAPVGGGTALALGNPPERVDLALSTERLAGIVDYEPTDLVLSVGAGARLGDVQAVLGEHGQRLPIDPPGGPDATIGGLIATALWGPLRHGSGTLRDLLIGIEVAHPDGTVSKAGGMVVKNVSGYDMPRVYHGSLGTLGVITSANFKVLPRPRAEASLLASYPRPNDAFAAASRIWVGHQPASALEVTRQNGAWQLACRIEGREQTVDVVARRIADECRAETTRLDGTESAAWWMAYVDRQRLDAGDGSVLVRAAVRPKEAGILAEGMANALEQIGVATSFLGASPGIGSVVARLDVQGDNSAERLAEVQGILLALAATTTILAAPPDWKRGIDVWGRQPEGMDVMRALRAQFDPESTINPGRFAGFL
jgi:glycolate oxidase FAD binding subunit